MSIFDYFMQQNILFGKCISLLQCLISATAFASASFFNSSKSVFFALGFTIVACYVIYMALFERRRFIIVARVRVSICMLENGVTWM